MIRRPPRSTLSSSSAASYVYKRQHVYRGVFGSHVAQVVRRLRRLCAQYGADPRFVLTSATIANPQAFAEKLVGLPFTVVDEARAPRRELPGVFGNPPSWTRRAASGAAPSPKPAT